MSCHLRLFFKNKFPLVEATGFTWSPFSNLPMYPLQYYCMKVGRLNHYCANNQKTGDPEWELMLSNLESRQIWSSLNQISGWLKFTPLETPQSSRQERDYFISKSVFKSKHSLILSEKIYWFIWNPPCRLWNIFTLFKIKTLRFHFRCEFCVSK